MKMKPLKIAFLLLVVLQVYDGVAQKENARKILGCWVLKNVEFVSKNEFSEQILQQARNSVVCFDASGKFTTTLGTAGLPPVTGSYQISADGKTMVQKKDNPEEGEVDEDSEIAMLDDKQLVFKLSFGTIYMDRK